MPNVCSVTRCFPLKRKYSQVSLLEDLGDHKIFHLEHVTAADLHRLIVKFTLCWVN